MIRICSLMAAAVVFVLCAGLVMPTGGCGGSTAAPPTDDNTLSDNTRLASLTTSLAAPLSPAFDPAVTDYEIRTLILPDEFVVTPTAQDASASITVNGLPVASGTASPPVPRTGTLTLVTVVVTATDGSTAATTIAIGRPDPEFLKALNAGTLDGFGVAVALSGDTLVVGAPGEAGSAGGGEGDNSAPGAGAAYVFVRTATGWNQQAYLKASNAESDDSFGDSVALDGDTLVVGAPNEESAAAGVDGDQSDNSLWSSGAAYVFTRGPAGWSQQAYLKASNPHFQGSFGGSVAISGNTIVVGAVFDPSSATGVNGDQSDITGWESGAAYVFTRSGSTWSQQAYVKASNTGHGDQFGHSVAIAGDTVVVGAKNEDSSATGVDGNQADNGVWTSGAAYVFVRTGTTWSQQAYLKASNTGEGDYFGCGVAILGDTIVVAAAGEDSSAIAVNGNQADNGARDSGAVYVFVRTGTTWSQQAYLKASNAEAGDCFGGFLFVERDEDTDVEHTFVGPGTLAITGDTILVGAAGEDSSAADGQADNGVSEAGAAYVFVRTGTTWSQQPYFKAFNAESRDWFAVVALSGDTLVVGAPGEDSSAMGGAADNSTLDAGAVYVYR